MKEIRNLSEAEQSRMLASLREQVRDIQFKLHSREVKNNHTLKNLKKDIARIMTVINQPK